MNICLDIFHFIMQWALSICRDLAFYNTWNFLLFLCYLFFSPSLFFGKLLIRWLLVLVDWSLMSSNFPLIHSTSFFPWLLKVFFKHLLKPLYWITYLGNIFNFSKLFLVCDCSFKWEACSYFTDARLIKLSERTN